MSEFERMYYSMGLQINVGKSKVLVVKEDQREGCENVRISGEERQEVDKFNYLGIMINRDGGMGYKVSHRVLEGRKVWGTIAKLWKRYPEK